MYKYEEIKQHDPKQSIINDEIKREIFLRQMKMETQHTKTYGIQKK
jgi:hypothetical protein